MNNNAYAPSVEHLIGRFNDIPIRTVPIDRQQAKDVLICNIEHSKERIKSMVQYSEEYNVLSRSIRGMEHELNTVYNHNKK